MEAPFDVAPGKNYPRTFKKFMAMVDQYKNDVWVFFDTETTGLMYRQAEVQATEVAAVAFNMNGLTSEPSEVPDGTFHMKVALQPDTISFMEQEPEEYEDSKKKTIAQLLVMTQYEDGPVVKSKPRDVALEFTDYINDMKAVAESQGGKVRLIAQNAVFDIGIMNILYQRSGIPVPDDIVWDTKAVFSGYLRDTLDFIRKKSKFGPSPRDAGIISALERDGKYGTWLSSSLGDLITAFEITGGENWHSAIADVALTMQALYEAVKYLRSKGDFLQSRRTRKEFDPKAGDPYNRKKRR